MHEVVYATHPFDVIGWDGYNFPYGFSIHNFEPITGRRAPTTTSTPNLRDGYFCSVFFRATFVRLPSKSYSCALQSQQYR